MWRLCVCICFLVTLLEVQAQVEGQQGNFRNLDAEEAAAGFGGTANIADTATSINDNGIQIPDVFGFDSNSSGNQPQFPAPAQQAQMAQPAQPNQLVVATPEGPGIQAGFQAVGSNYATSLSGGINSPDGETLETGLNLSGRFGDSTQPRATQQQAMYPQQRSTGSQFSGTGTQFPSTGTQFPGTASQFTGTGTQFPGSGTQFYGAGTQYYGTGGQSPGVGTEFPGSGTQFSGRLSSTQNSQGMSTPLQDEGATFTVSYKPGLLSAIGNMLNPFRFLQQLGDAVVGMTGLGRGNAMFQTQSQYTPPQAQRINRNSNGLGVTWKPLYQTLPFYS